VLEKRGHYRPWCSRAPANVCVFLESGQDGKQLMLTAFDPLKGRGRVLRTIERDPSRYVEAYALSADGSTFAISNGGEADIHVHLLSLKGGADSEVVVKGWSNLTGLNPSNDGRGFYIGCRSPRGSTLLYADLRGNARVMWQSRGGRYTSGIPSPDGHHLAMLGFFTSSNMWMLEGF